MPRHSVQVIAALGVAAALGFALPASAQIADLTFERWCLENQGWEEARCDARSEEDLAEFKLYRDQVERYEAEFRRKQEAERLLRERVDTQGNTNPDTSREVGE
ncbi:MAG TPA: hypothetical protein PLA85_13155 [Micropepsaceae bacterium]|nr:hypothetical protein [Micropepsaceae bacterium]HRK72530.1 hypothetical protein [Micropepsaceae bacterium]